MPTKRSVSWTVTDMQQVKNNLQCAAGPASNTTKAAKHSHCRQWQMAHTAHKLRGNLRPRSKMKFCRTYRFLWLEEILEFFFLAERMVFSCLLFLHFSNILTAVLHLTISCPAPLFSYSLISVYSSHPPAHMLSYYIHIKESQLKAEVV